MSTTTTTPLRAPKSDRARTATGNRDELLARYTDPRGRAREVVRRPGAGGSRLVIDRLAGGPSDERLVAHLAADEPLENARIVTSLYLADPRDRHCRRLTPEDLTVIPFASESTPAVGATARLAQNAFAELTDRRGRAYSLQPNGGDVSLPQLRWFCHAPCQRSGSPQPVTVREVIGSLERCEPIRTLTAQASERQLAVAPARYLELAPSRAGCWCV